MKLQLLALALSIHGACAFTLGRVPSAPIMRRALTMSEEAPAEEAEEAPAAETLAEAPADDKEIDGNTFAVQAPMVDVGLGEWGFDFSGTPKFPTDARGKGGLNDQGFQPYEKAVADKTENANYLIGLGLAAVGVVALSLFNVG